MTTHILSRKDGKTYYLTLTPAEAELIMHKIDTGESIRAKGDIFSGYGCSLTEVGETNDVNTSSRMRAGSLENLANQVFSLPVSQHKRHFWQEIVACNIQRHKRRLRWLFDQDIFLLRELYDDLAASDLVACGVWEGVV